MFKNVCLFYFPGHFAMVMLYVIFTFFVEIMNTVYKLRKFNLLLFRDQKIVSYSMNLQMIQE